MAAPLTVRFWKYVAPTLAGCWLWTGARDNKGYGRIGVRTSRNAKAHRVAWELMRGPIPAGLLVRHLVCANPGCVNPNHLALGTVRDNYQDAVRDGRHMGRRRKSPNSCRSVAA